MKGKIVRRGVVIVACLSVVFLLLHLSFSTSGPLIGDVNLDGNVDLSDAVLLALAYNSHGAGYGSSWSVASSFAVGSDWTVGGVAASSNWNVNADFNFDGTITLADAVLLAINYGVP